MRKIKMSLLKEKWLEILCGIIVITILSYAAMYEKEVTEFLKCFGVGC